MFQRVEVSLFSGSDSTVVKPGNMENQVLLLCGESKFEVSENRVNLVRQEREGSASYI